MWCMPQYLLNGNKGTQRPVCSRKTVAISHTRTPIPGKPLVVKITLSQTVRYVEMERVDGSSSTSGYEERNLQAVISDFVWT